MVRRPLVAECIGRVAGGQWQRQWQGRDCSRETVAEIQWQRDSGRETVAGEGLWQRMRV